MSHREVEIERESSWHAYSQQCVDDIYAQIRKDPEGIIGNLEARLA